MVENGRVKRALEEKRRYACDQCQRQFVTVEQVIAEAELRPRAQRAQAE